jgi:hypothetical protein
MKNPLSVLKLIILLALTSFSQYSFADWPWLDCIVPNKFSNGSYQENHYHYLYENRKNMFDPVLAEYSSDTSNKKRALQLTWWGGPSGANYLQIFVDNQQEVILPKSNYPYNRGRFVYNSQKDRKPGVLTFENIKEAQAFCDNLRSLCVQLWRNDWGQQTGGEDKVIRAAYHGYNDVAFSLIVLYQEKNNTTGDLIEKPKVCSPPSDFN